MFKYLTIDVFCMTKSKKFVIYTRLDDETLDRIDHLIDEKEFDNRSSFIRKAVVKYLREFETKILA